jgi:hypothetical protein
MMNKFDDNADLNEALTNFKSSVHAWSEAAYSSPRSVTREVKVRSWRLAAGWALGCVLVAGSVSGGLMERQHRQHVASLAAQLAGVDSAVSRQVPSAMEPLGQMMADDETR